MLPITDPLSAIVVSAIVGLLIGSFLNVVIHRLPVMLERRWQAEAAELRGESLPEAPKFNLITPGSTCPACGHRITALENIPIISWLILRGRCSACKTPISVRYPVVEAVTGLLFALCAWQFGPTGTAIAAMALCATLVTLTAIDLDTQLLPDNLTLPLLWLGLIVNLSGLFARLPDAVVGAVAGYLVLWSVYWLFKLLTGREGMGYGDFKLLAALGAWFGWQALPMILLISSVIGAAVGVGLIALRRGARGTAIAFGPYLALAGLAALFAGERLRTLVLS
ncbi:MAG: prepilin peptidase [Casimicrobiaceae bacterium]